MLIECHRCAVISSASVCMLIIYMDFDLLIHPGTFCIFGIAAMYETNRMSFVLSMLVYLLGRKAGPVNMAVS